MDTEQIKKFLERFDLKGLAEAYQKSERSLAEKEWKELFEFIRDQENRAWLSSRRCTDCGKEKDANLTDSCDRCLEEN